MHFPPSPVCRVRRLPLLPLGKHSPIRTIRPMIYRIDVFPAQTATTVDHSGESIRHQIAEFGVQVGKVATRRIFLIDTDASAEQVQRIATKLWPTRSSSRPRSSPGPPADADVSRIEIHLKPGVMDPVAASTEMAIRDMGLAVTRSAPAGPTSSKASSTSRSSSASPPASWPTA